MTVDDDYLNELEQAARAALDGTGYYNMKDAWNAFIELVQAEDVLELIALARSPSLKNQATDSKGRALRVRDTGDSFEIRDL